MLISITLQYPSDSVRRTMPSMQPLPFTPCSMQMQMQTISLHSVAPHQVLSFSIRRACRNGNEKAQSQSQYSVNHWRRIILQRYDFDERVSRYRCALIQAASSKRYFTRFSLHLFINGVPRFTSSISTIGSAAQLAAT
jgi:hypothetical protein